MLAESLPVAISDQLQTFRLLPHYCSQRLRFQSQTAILTDDGKPRGVVFILLVPRLDLNALMNTLARHRDTMVAQPIEVHAVEREVNGAVTALVQRVPTGVTHDEGPREDAVLC
jgi:hypothetical protein